MPITDVRVKLLGEDGNAFAIMWRVTQALRKEGLGDIADAFIAEATSGDYAHLLETVWEYVDTDNDYEEEN